MLSIRIRHILVASFFFVFVLLICLYGNLYNETIPLVTSIWMSAQINASQQNDTRIFITRNKSSDLELSARLIGSWKLPIALQRGFVLENPTFCKSIKDLLLLIVVNSAPSYFTKRKVIRDTWGREEYLEAIGKIKLLFVVGRPVQALQNKLQKELNNYGDLLQGDFVDTYYQLTNKGVSQYKWITNKCQNAKYILRVDDDVVVNMYNLYQIIQNLNGANKTVVCDKVFNKTINRKEGAKFYIPNHIFPNQSTYPPYCRGYFYLATNDLTLSMYEAMRSTPFFPFEDVYLTGLVLNKIKDVNFRLLTVDECAVGTRLTNKCTSQDLPIECNKMVVSANLNETQINDYFDRVLKRNQTARTSW